MKICIRAGQRVDIGPLRYSTYIHYFKYKKDLLTALLPNHKLTYKDTKAEMY